MPALPESANGRLARLAQSYEGHGFVVPPQGDFPGPPRSSVDPAAASEAEGGGRSLDETLGEPHGRITVHAHLRERVIPIYTGSGRQQVFWLATVATQRYLSDLGSYSKPFSRELTPRAVLRLPPGDTAPGPSEAREYISNQSRIADELCDGAHVWIEVGDGKPNSGVGSRQLPRGESSLARRRSRSSRGSSRILLAGGGSGLLEADDGDGDGDGVRQISPLEAQLLLAGEGEGDGQDKRPKMLRRTRTGNFRDWQLAGRQGMVSGSGAPGGEEEEDGAGDGDEAVYEAFQAVWKAMNVGDLPGFSLVESDCRAILYRFFERLAHIYREYSASNHPHGGAPASMFTMSLAEFWKFCQNSRATTRYLNLAQITLLFTSINSKNRDDPFNPRRAFTLHEFLESIVRLSVMRQAKPHNPEVPLPDCLEEFLTEHVFKHDLFVSNGQIVRERLAESECSEVFVRHSAKLQAIFEAYTSKDNSKEHMGLITFDDWLHMFKAAQLIDSALTITELRQAFVSAQIDEALVDFEADSCRTLIYIEFEEALGRAALLKFAEDDVASDAEKVNEIVTLLIASPVGSGRRLTSWEATRSASARRSRTPANTVRESREGGRGA